MIAKFSKDWHEVPAGTEVRIVRTLKDQSFVVMRTDGQKLPGPFVAAYEAVVAAEFIHPIAP